jgi:putative transposase
MRWLLSSQEFRFAKLVARHTPRIHGEMVKLGFDVSERSVPQSIRRAPRDPDPVNRWLTFLRNDREAIPAMDFFTVPTPTFGVLI